VEPDGVRDLELNDLSAHVRERLASYKAPRELVVVDSIGRAPNGKVDYKASRIRALKALGLEG
jgi:fatty-acyl-CoA synthase